MSRLPATSIHSAASTKSPSVQPPSLAKRLLFPQLRKTDSPAIFLSENVPEELTEEIYNFVALALRAFVNPWWTRITRYDKEFLPEITSILTHVFRELEQRALAADFVPLVYQDLPIILTQHYTDYRNARSKLATSYAGAGSLSLPLLFHQLQGHIAVSSDGTVDREYFRQIIDHILFVCLPPEDYSPEAERFIIREVVLKVVLDDVIPKIVQPWFIQKIILDQLGSQSQGRATHGTSSTPSQFSFHSILVFFLSAVQSISGACLALAHAYKRVMTTIARVNENSFQIPVAENVSRRSVHDIPEVRSPFSVSTSSSQSTRLGSPVSSSPVSVRVDAGESRDHVQNIIALVAEVFTLNTRMAASTFLSAITVVGSLFATFLDRLLPFLLSQVLTSRFLLDVTRISRQTLFPNGYPGPPPLIPTAAEQAEIRKQLMAWRGNGAIAMILPFILGPDPSVIIGEVLDPLSDPSCNMHLLVLIVDCVVGHLFPELIVIPDP